MSNTHPFNPELDAIIIGAGMSGMYQLYKLRYQKRAEYT